MARYLFRFAAFTCVIFSSTAFHVTDLSKSLHNTQSRLSEFRSVALRSKQAACGGLTMGKGKGVPVNMRGEYQKRSQLEQMQQQMLGNDRDGLPIFTLYTRSKIAKIW